MAVSLILIPPLGASGAAGAFAISGFLSWWGTTIYVDRLLANGMAIARAVARPLAGGISALVLVLAGGDRWLPLGLALSTGVMLTDRSVRALLPPLRRAPP